MQVSGGSLCDYCAHHNGTEWVRVGSRGLASQVLLERSHGSEAVTTGVQVSFQPEPSLCFSLPLSLASAIARVLKVKFYRVSSFDCFKGVLRLLFVAFHSACRHLLSVLSLFQHFERRHRARFSPALGHVQRRLHHFQDATSNPPKYNERLDPSTFDLSSNEVFRW